jgi:hypothetical protein
VFGGVFGDVGWEFCEWKIWRGWEKTVRGGKFEAMWGSAVRQCVRQCGDVSEQNSRIFYTIHFGYLFTFIHNYIMFSFSIANFVVIVFYESDKCVVVVIIAFFILGNSLYSIYRRKNHFPFFIIFNHPLQFYSISIIIWNNWIFALEKTYISLFDSFKLMKLVYFLTLGLVLLKKVYFLIT